MDEASQHLWRDFERAARAPLWAAMAALREARTRLAPDEELEVVLAPDSLPGVTHIYGVPVTRSWAVARGQAMIFNRTRLQYELERTIQAASPESWFE